MKNALITFYTELYNSIAISNGFSFFRHVLEGEDIFVCLGKTNKEKLRRQLEGYDAVYCSISFFKELDYIGPLIQKNWVIGGPLVEHCGEHLRRRFKCTVVDKPFEVYHQMPLSTTFTDYWHDKMHLLAYENYPVIYNCSIGKGCNWGKCKFCNFSIYEGYAYKRSNIESIISGFRENKNGTFIIHFCISSSTPDIIQGLLDYQPVLEKLTSYSELYARADKQIIDIAKKAQSLKGMIFVIGLEAFSQRALNILGKGIQLSDVVQLTKIIVEKGGNVRLSIMDHYPFLTLDMAKESKKTIDELSKIPQASHDSLQKTTAGMSVFNNGITAWPTQEIAKSFSSHVKPFPCSRLYSDFNGIGWNCKIERNSEAFKANRMISEYLYEKNITVFGEEFISLEKPRIVRKLENYFHISTKHKASDSVLLSLSK